MERDERLNLVPRENLSRLPGGSLWSPGGALEPDTSLTWEHALRILRKHLLLMVFVAGGFTLAIFTLVFLMRDTYDPAARIEIDPGSGGIRTLQEIEGPPMESDADYLETQVQILHSDALAMRVIRSLHLDRNSEFSGAKTKAASTPASSPTPDRLASESVYLQEQLELADPTPSEAAALLTFHQGFSADSVRNSRLVEVRFKSHDPRLAQQVLNSLVAQFIDQNYKNRYTTTMEASEWLSAQLNDLRQKVQESNQAVVEYQKRHGLVDIDDKDLPSAQLMAEVSHQLSDAQADRIQSEAFVRMIDLGQSESVPALRDDAVYQNLMTQYSDSRAKLAQARTIYGDENTNVKKLENEANEFAAQIDAERSRMLNRVRTSFAAARAREEMLTESRQKLQAQMGDVTSQLVEYRMLRSAALANSQLYNTLQTRLHEAGIYAGLRSSNIRIVDLAPFLQRPTGPHRKLIIAAGGLLSCIFAVVLAFVRESLDNTVRTPDDVWNWVNLPSLALLPAVKDSANLPYSNVQTGWQTHMGQLLNRAAPHGADGEAPKVFWSPSVTAGAEAIRGLRTVLEYATQGATSRVFLIASSAPGEGKTTVAVNLACVLASQGKTCLIEADLRRPVIEKTLGISSGPGLGDVLHGRVSLEDALTPVHGVAGLFVLPAKALAASPSDLIASGHMRATLTVLREKFPTIIIDSPPLIPFSDARCLASLADAVVLVGRYGRTTRRAITRGFQLLADVQAPVIGVVLNDVDFSSADYRYFNYGYGGRLNGGTFPGSHAVPPPPDSSGRRPPEKSKSAHA